VADYVSLPDGPASPETPELDKMHAARADSQPVGEFLEWLSNQGLQICRFNRGIEQYQADYRTIEQMLADWKGINLTQVETERRAVIAWFQETNR
jgi:hypothetical protein